MPTIDLPLDPVVVPHGRTRSPRWPPAPGRRWSPSPGRTGAALQHRHAATWSACCRSPRGPVHVLKFSRNGGVLLAGGGRGGQSGRASSGTSRPAERIFEVGEEYDAVLAADISPDHGAGRPRRARPGPARLLDRATASSVHELKKHTEWVTALEFSPDGVLLATGDRNGGLFVWEADTGREMFTLRATKPRSPT